MEAIACFSMGFPCVQYFWGVVNQGGMSVGFKDLNTKTHLPTWFMMPVAHICDLIGWLLGRKLRVNPFTVSYGARLCAFFTIQPCPAARR